LHLYQNETLLLSVKNMKTQVFCNHVANQLMPKHFGLQNMEVVKTLINTYLVIETSFTVSKSFPQKMTQQLKQQIKLHKDVTKYCTKCMLKA